MGRFHQDDRVWSRRSVLFAASAFGFLIAMPLVASGQILHDFSTTQDTVKRRQQGILTGMPFMSNVAPRTFVDDLGRKIFLSTTPTRIVSLAPSITEILFAIGAGDSVVGVTEFCDYPEEALSKPHVGDSRPNLEAILALRPDLVLAMEVIRDDVLQNLQELKIPLFILEAKSIEQVYLHVQTIGRMLNRVKEANAVAQDMRQDMQALVDRTKGLKKPRVLYVVYPEPFISVGPGSFIHQLIEMAGGENIAKDAGTAYPRLSLEAVMQKDPEVLVFPARVEEGVRESDLQQWKRWTTLSAVKHGRLYHVPWTEISRPGPRLVLGAQALAQVIHPELFKGTSGE